MYYFGYFDAYLGRSEKGDIPLKTKKECTISTKFAGIPEGWSLQVMEVKGEGYVYLETGAVATFNATINWSEDDEHIVSNILWG